ncbi:MAG: hypothetical protein QOC56_91, partial [Alphaproteobacteria bacterium]|nr:hypothetical protein [Alphaproteobacteria bacterium]
MSEAIQNASSWLRDMLAWAPDNLVGALILAIAAAIALSIHRTVLRLLRRLLRGRHPYVRSFLLVTTRLTRLALLVLALFVALPVTPFDADTTAILAKLLVIASIVLVGWATITAVNMAANLYLRRLQIDTRDNLIVRKQLTQVRLMTRAVNTLLVIATAGIALMTLEPVRQYGVSLFASAGVAGLIVGLAARPVLSNL